MLCVAECVSSLCVQACYRSQQQPVGIPSCSDLPSIGPSASWLAEHVLLVWADVQLEELSQAWNAAFLLPSATLQALRSRRRPASSPPGKSATAACLALLAIVKGAPVASIRRDSSGASRCHRRVRRARSLRRGARSQHAPGVKWLAAWMGDYLLRRLVALLAVGIQLDWVVGPFQCGTPSRPDLSSDLRSPVDLGPSAARAVDVHGFTLLASCFST